MNKKGVQFIVKAIMIILAGVAHAQQDGSVDDVIAPNGSATSNVRDNVNNSTGIINFSVPIASISSKSLSYPISFSYNGQSAFDQGQYLNRYNPTGILGVGWNINIPKIVAGTKETGTRDDDDFFIQGNSNSQLICFNKNEPDYNTEGVAYWEFKSEAFTLYSYKYYRYSRDYDLNIGYVDTPLDYWEIIDDSGVSHIYGQTDNSRESVLAWGNWIGDSNNPSNAVKHTIAWNLSEIKNQWDDNISFTYEKVERGISAVGIKHTESSYLKEILANTGEKAQFNYTAKTGYEYYEPHNENVEPDGYQERFTSKFLDKISIHDRSDQLVYAYQLGYDLQWHTLSDRKRYLNEIIHQDAQGVSLPPQTFEYYYSGDFKGGLKKANNPSGGYTQYIYKNEYAFTNNNSIDSDQLSSGYNYTAANYAANNYSLRLQWQGNDPTPTGNHNFRILRDSWTGKNWKRTEHLLNEPISFDNHNNISTLDNARFVFGEDFYATLIFKRSTNKGYLYLSHLSNDGRTWIDTKYTNLSIVSKDDSHREEDPVLLVGDDFVAIGSNRTGKLRKYSWNGSDGWNDDLADYGPGQYYYAASNNFILVLDEDGGSDIITGVNYSDNYYIDYLDSTKAWKTKSWSANIDPHISGIDDPSYFYPSNSMSSFMADNQNEYFIRWDTEYNVVSVDDVIGQYNDTWPLLPVGNNMFVLFELVNFGNINPKKAFAFDGNTWDVKIIANSKGTGLHINKSITQRFYSGSYHIELNQFDPTAGNWLTPITLANAASNDSQASAYTFGNDLFMAGHYLYRLENNGYSSLGQVNSYDRTNFTATGSGDYIYGEYYDTQTGIKVDKGYIYYINKRTGDLESIVVKNYLDDQIWSNLNRKAKSFGGHYPFFAKSVFLDKNNDFKRIIDNEIDQVVNAKVVDNVEQNNGEGVTYKMEYTYDEPSPSRNNSAIYFGRVDIENKGSNNNSLGKIKHFYNTGDNDIRFAGLLNKREVYDANNVLLRKAENTYTKTDQNLYNSELDNIGRASFIRNTQSVENLYLNGQQIDNTVVSAFNTNGLITSVKRIDGSEILEEITTEYASEQSQFSFLNDRNMLSFPFKVKTKNNNTVVTVKEIQWALDNNRVSLLKSSSGTDELNIRVDIEVTEIDSYGNSLESSSGLNLYNSILMGYNHVNQVATITNAKYQDVINELDVSYAVLQTLDNTSLEAELMKLYSRLPASLISIDLYDTQGRIIKSIDNREYETFYYYDSFGRFDYTTDADGMVLEKREYNYGN